MLVVPCLRYIGGFDEKHSHATSIAVVMPLSFLSVLVYTVKGVSEFTLAWQVGLGVIVGGVIGALLLKRMQKSLLNLLFYGMMIYVGVRFIR